MTNSIHQKASCLLEMTCPSYHLIRHSTWFLRCSRADRPPARIHAYRTRTRPKIPAVTAIATYNWSAISLAVPCKDAGTVYDRVTANERESILFPICPELSRTAAYCFGVCGTRCSHRPFPRAIINIILPLLHRFSLSCVGRGEVHAHNLDVRSFFFFLPLAPVAARFSLNSYGTAELS